MPRKANPDPEDQFIERVELRISTAEKELFADAAKRHGLLPSQWIRLAARMVAVLKNGKIEGVEIP